MRRPLACAAGALLLAGLLVTSRSAIAQPDDAGSVSIGLADAADHASDDPRSAHYVINAVARGNTFEREVVVTNSTADELTIDVYVGDAGIRGRRFAFDDEQRPGGVASWSRVSPSSMPLAAGASGTAVVSITPPLDATPAEHYGVIWAQLPKGDDATVINRVGVRIYLALGGDEPPPSDLSIDLLTASRDGLGGAQLAVNVTNTGGRALDVAGTVALRGQRGSRVSVELDPGTVIAPGDSGEAMARVPEVEDGPWDATVVVRANGVERRATGTVSFPSEPDRQARPVVVAAPSRGTKPLLVVLTAAALVVVALGSVIRHRRRRGA